MTAVRHLAVVPDVGVGDDGRGLSVLEQWELYMRGAGRSNRTISETLGVMRRLQEFAGCRLEAVGPLDIARFLGRRRLKQNSRASYFGYIHSFYRWWGDNGGVNKAAKLPRPKAPKGVPRPITDQQLQNLLEVRMHNRTRVMILLAAFAGLRVHEIAKVRGEDVDPMARTIRVTGKGNVTAQLPLHALLVEAARGMPRRGWWFPGNSQRPGLPIRSRGVSDIIGDAMDRAGIPGGTAHRLRHWYGTTLVSSGTDLRTTQTLMRHAQLNTTAIYVQVSNPKHAEAIDRLPCLEATPNATTPLERCKASVVRALGGLDSGAQMPHTELLNRLATAVRPQLSVAIDELSDEGIVLTSVTGRRRSYRLAPEHHAKHKQRT